MPHIFPYFPLVKIVSTFLLLILYVSTEAVKYTMFSKLKKNGKSLIFELQLLHLVRVYAYYFIYILIVVSSNTIFFNKKLHFIMCFNVIKFGTQMDTETKITLNCTSTVLIS